MLAGIPRSRWRGSSKRRPSNWLLLAGVIDGRQRWRHLFAAESVNLFEAPVSGIY